MNKTLNKTQNNEKAIIAIHDRVLVARVNSAHGIRGLVKVQSFTANPDDFATYEVLVDENNNPLNFQIVGEAKSMFLVQFDQVNTRNQAEELKGLNIYTSRESLGELDDEEFFLNDLVGLNIIDENNKKYGLVDKVVNYGSCDLLQVKTSNNKSFLVPMTEEKIKLIDFDNDQIIVNNIKELLDLGGIKEND